MRIPKHLAVIMDGNGRWAMERGLPRIAGHYEGVKKGRGFGGCMFGTWYKMANPFYLLYRKLEKARE